LIAAAQPHGSRAPEQATILASFSRSRAG
jgi:hypothetical protein